MSSYEDEIYGLNSKDREDKNAKIINEFKAFLKLNNSVYATFSGVKNEIDSILNNIITVDEAEYYQKSFPTFFEHLKNIKADLSFFPEYTFAPEYQKLIDKHYTFIMRDMTLAEAETSKSKMLQLLKENKSDLPNYIEKKKKSEDLKFIFEFPTILCEIINKITNEDDINPFDLYIDGRCGYVNILNHIDYKNNILEWVSQSYSIYYDNGIKLEVSRDRIFQSIDILGVFNSQIFFSNFANGFEIGRSKEPTIVFERNGIVKHLSDNRISEEKFNEKLHNLIKQFEYHRKNLLFEDVYDFYIKRN